MKPHAVVIEEYKWEDSKPIKVVTCKSKKRAIEKAREMHPKGPLLKETGLLDGYSWYTGNKGKGSGTRIFIVPIENDG